MKQFDGAVIYTDGSAKPNPGNTGWGVHGYFYNIPEVVKRKVVAKFHLATTYGYIHQNELGQNPRAILVDPVEYMDGFGSGEKNGSNNSAEVDALYYSLTKINTDYTITALQVFTDSEYLRKGIVEWRVMWERNNYIRQDGTILGNKEKWIRLFKEIDLLVSKDIKFSVDWVKGHNDIFGNVVADRLATLAMLYTTKNEHRVEFDIASHSDYWRSEVERHPFIDFSKLYFNSQKQYNIIGQYFLADPGKDELAIGKKTSDTSYCVLRIDNGDPVIETVKAKQMDVSRDANAIMLMRLDRLYSPDVYKYIAGHGDIVLYPNGFNDASLNFIDKKPITIERNPAGLSIKAIEALVFLEDLMERYVAIKQDCSNQTGRIVALEDITKHFFEMVPDKKGTPKTKLRVEIDNTLECIKIPLQIIAKDGKTIEKNIPIVFGSDILRRNGLKKLENLDPVITLLTWYESPTSIRYATVIQTQGALGIWSNYYADRIFF